MIEIRSCTAKLLKDEFQIDPQVTELLFEKGILADHICRNVLIKQEYSERVEATGRQRLKGRIADKYCISVELVEKIIKK